MIVCAQRLATRIVVLSFLVSLVAGHAVGMARDLAAPAIARAAYDINSAGETPRELVLAGDPQFLVVLTGQEKRLRCPEASRTNRGPVPEVARMPTALAGPFCLGEARTACSRRCPIRTRASGSQLADFAGDVSETLGPSGGNLDWRFEDP